VTLDDESVKVVGQTAGAGVLLAVLVGFGRWFLKITGLPSRVDKMETRSALSDGVLLALAEYQLAVSPVAKKESRQSLREAKEAYLNGMVSTGKKK
jgi:hypothetical protein